ncbi:hypothetical protein GPY51_22490 [Photorhabdus laumondii subsp. laumondii]|uniref:Uncharacterized protein n=1 Tax=Photorhabdus laumondii subsp. laumondii TaxID=141679 RepID=A0A6L9JUG9_PHOLM|nr:MULTISPECIES: hypothetical protein [Photorhabdus]AXG42189.1 hypothetical protein PluDJC_07935 [Photorhabdus laumondii subsp. laumondii]MCC8389245.1 hypothetical protein [Photorhabdus laumondii]MCC8415681.1 hypothetical protein [Photorhabdus laumondii]MCZ1250597.1 hypothetical protein [Photorhabdus laumondii subsp. laumondii]NDK97126.1 hypothetical protein [Photorhabdus laumondii subsp. laumondii]
MENSEKLILELERFLKGCPGLTQWEYDFINGLSRYFRRGKYLTGRQKNIARSLIKKYSEGSKKPVETLARHAPVLAGTTQNSVPKGDYVTESALREWGGKTC